MLYNVGSCWLYLKEYANDARSHESQTLRNLVVFDHFEQEMHKKLLTCKDFSTGYC